MPSKGNLPFSASRKTGLQPLSARDALVARHAVELHGVITPKPSPVRLQQTIDFELSVAS